jgi:predicted transcriptional regulator
VTAGRMVSFRADPRLMDRVDRVARARRQTRTIWILRALARQVRADEALFDVQAPEDADHANE